MKSIVLATKNPNKVKEIRELFYDLNIEIMTLEDFPDTPLIIEDGNTFEENALKKARIVAKSTGKPSIADDSGLEVICLNGKPGVYSARYAGIDSSDKENNMKLLNELKDVPLNERAARYVCVVALVTEDGYEKTFRGECKGIIVDIPRGKGGFGYDPIFFIPEKGKTMAELSLKEKNQISHRGKAFRSLKGWIVKGSESKKTLKKSTIVW